MLVVYIHRALLCCWCDQLQVILPQGELIFGRLVEEKKKKQTQKPKKQEQPDGKGK